MKHPLKARRSLNRPGAAVTEFALVLPLMILLVLGCLDFGRFAYTLIAVENAARAGAGYAIMNPYLKSGKTAWEAAIQEAAREEMTNQKGYDSTKLTTTTSVVIETNGLHRVKVTATYNSFDTIVAWPGIPESMVLTGFVEMRAIR